MLQIVIMLVNGNAHRDDTTMKWTSPMLRLGGGDDVFRQTRNFCEDTIAKLDAEERRMKNIDVPTCRRNRDARPQ